MFYLNLSKMTINELMKRSTWLLVLLSVVFVGCNDDEEDDVEPMNPTGSITVSDQMLTENNSIIISSVTLDADGWIVVHASTEDGSGPVVPDIISEAKMVSSGTTENVEVMLNSDVEIEDGDVVWVMLHTDDGTMGTYEFDGANGFDGPILDDAGNIVMTSITLSVEGDPTGTLTVMDQALSQNMVHVSNVTLDRSGFIVVHAAADGGPEVPAIISEALPVEAGSSDDLMVELTDFSSLEDGATLYVMLHTDDGEAGVYEFDGASGIDNPIFDAEGNIVMTAITVTAPSISVESQVVSENMVTIGQVEAAVDGWLVIHADDGEGAPGPVLGQTMVSAGSNSDVMVDLGDATFAGGEMLFPMLHIESPADGEYGFPDNGDGPEIFGDDVVVVGFEMMAPSGEISVIDQPVDANTIIVDEITLNATGWVVVHASNANNDGPQVPEIISTPVQLPTGTSTNVEITLTEVTEGSDVLYVMLHTENGSIGDYEFDGANGFDGPITIQSMTVEASTGSITVSDQVLQGNMLTVGEITMNATGWVVVHASNANNDGPQVPEIISTPVQVEAGTSTNVMVTLTEVAAADDVLYVMLHTENGTVGEYEFDGANGFDGPITTEAFTVGAPTGSFSASNQVTSQDMITVESITVGQPSWVVIHRDNGAGSFVAPGIISEPVALEAGTTTDVQIYMADGESLTDGETLWIMLHNDNGTVGAYEFDGVNGFDAPITFSSIDITAPSVTVADQAISASNTVTIGEVVAGVDGWIVIHEDNGSGEPGPVIGQTMVQAGTNTDVVVDLGDATKAAGDMLYPMLHIESPADGVYGFPDNGDGPEIFDGDVVVASFTVQ